MLSKLPLTMLATKLSEILPDKTFFASALPAPYPTLTDVKANAPISSIAALKELCEQARFGLDGETVTDLSVRKTLRAGPDAVSVSWPQLDFAAQQAGRELSLLGDVTAELHDVLLYEPGDFFKPHVDTKKHLHHQATMVVEVGLDRERCVGGMLATATGAWKSSGPGSFAAWVTNVEHEVTPVVSGCRVVATYKLLVDPATAKPAVESLEADPLVMLLRRNAGKYLATFEIALAEQAKGEFPMEFVAFWLSRCYSTDGNGEQVPASNLNGADRVLYNGLLKAYDCTAMDLQVMPVVHGYDEAEGRGDYLGDQSDSDCSVYIDDEMYLSGCEYQRSCYVDGAAMQEEIYRGFCNDEGDPIYTYHKSYIRVPARLLRKWAEIYPLVDQPQETTESVGKKKRGRAEEEEL